MAADGLRVDEAGGGALDDLEAQIRARHELEHHVEHPLRTARVYTLHWSIAAGCLKGKACSSTRRINLIKVSIFTCGAHYAGLVTVGFFTQNFKVAHINLPQTS